MEGRWIAHVPKYPGCFASSDDLATALDALPACVRDYVAWRKESNLPIDPPTEPFVIDEQIRAWNNADIEVNVFFADDRLPLLMEELDEMRLLLQKTRADLLEVAEGIEPQKLLRKLEGERWSIAGVLSHVARAEWWYLDRLGLSFDWEIIPDDSFKRLSAAREHFYLVLPSLGEVTGVRHLDGETWSPRKVIRRALWHERDYTQHISSLLEGMQ
jgi:predicted RNase H-like HicB family nuclease